MSKIKIKNLSAEINHRIKLIKTQTSVVDIGQQQGAVVNQSDYVGICLAPFDVPVNGCEGATNSVRFTSQGNHQYNSGYNLEINGVFYRDFDWVGETGISYLDYLINNFIPPNLLALDLHSNGGASYPVDWTIKSLASENLKVLISPFASPCDFQVHPDNDNPTVSSPNTSQWSFCLSPETNQISCDGAGQVTGLAIGYYEPNGENQEDWIVAEQVRLKFNNDERFITLNGTTPPYTTEYSEIGDFFDQYLIGANGDFNQAPFEGEVQFLQNSDPQNPVRFEYELLPSNQTQFRVATFGDNPAHENVTPIFTRACFAPFVSPITCDGAESSVEMAFAIKDGETPTLDVFFLVDNEIVDLMNNPPPYITKEVLNKVYDGSVPAGFSTGNGVLKFTNTDSAPHRIEVYTDNFQNVRIVANHNPTVIELDAELIGAYIGVCLSLTPI